MLQKSGCDGNQAYNVATGRPTGQAEALVAESRRHTFQDESASTVAMPAWLIQADCRGMSLSAHVICNGVMFS
jgi:hypothetical protein